MWQRAYLSISSLMGEPLDAALEALDHAPDEVRALAAELGSAQKAQRAQALAKELTKILHALEREVVR